MNNMKTEQRMMSEIDELVKLYLKQNDWDIKIRIIYSDEDLIVIGDNNIIEGVDKAVIIGDNLIVNKNKLK